jgi:hypothetical protein
MTNKEKLFEKILSDAIAPQRGLLRLGRLLLS